MKTKSKAPRRRRARGRVARRSLLVVAFWAAVVAGCIALYGVARDAALVERGYRAIGGEVFILLLPVIIYAGGRTVADWIITIGELHHRGEEREQ